MLPEPWLIDSLTIFWLIPCYLASTPGYGDPLYLVGSGIGAYAFFIRYFDPATPPPRMGLLELIRDPVGLLLMMWPRWYCCSALTLSCTLVSLTIPSCLLLVSRFMPAGFCFTLGMPDLCYFEVAGAGPLLSIFLMFCWLVVFEFYKVLRPLLDPYGCLAFTLDDPWICVEVLCSMPLRE